MMMVLYNILSLMSLLQQKIVYLRNNILVSHEKKNKILSLMTMWMDAEGITLSAIGRQRKRNTL